MENNIENHSSNNEDKLAMITEMISKVEISAEKPWPVHIHAEPKSFGTRRPMLMATIDMCPFPAHSRLMPFPFQAIGQKDTKIREILFNKAMGTCASLPLFAPVPILLPPLTAMLTGKPSSIMSYNLKEQQQRYRDIFEKLYNDAQDKEAFLESKEAKKLRFLHQTLGMDARSHERTLRAFSVQSWEPVQSAVSIFVFYSKVMDVIRQSHGFVSESNTEEFDRYSKLIDEAEKLFQDNSKYVYDDCVTLDTCIKAAVEFLKKNSTFLFSDKELIQGVETHMDRSNPFLVSEEELAILPPINLAEKGAFIVRDFTIRTLHNMEQWIMHVCEIPPAFRDTISLTRQPPPIGENIDAVLYKEMKDQADYLQEVRTDAFSTFWQSNKIEPVLFLPKGFFCEFPEKDKKTFLVKTLTTVARTRTQYLSVIDHVLRCKNVSSRKSKVDAWKPFDGNTMQWYPDAASRQQPLNVFAFSFQTKGKKPASSSH